MYYEEWEGGSNLPRTCERISAPRGDRVSGQQWKRHPWLTGGTEGVCDWPTGCDVVGVKVSSQELGKYSWSAASPLTTDLVVKVIFVT